MDDHLKSKLGRREFLGAAAAASFMILKPQQVRGTAANSQLRFGILGCGGRATAEGSSFVENADARVTAIADLLPTNWRRGAGTLTTCSKPRATRPSILHSSSRVPMLISKSPNQRKWTSF